jgi:hypothetical protein
MNGKSPLWKVQQASEARMGERMMRAGAKKKAVEKVDGRAARAEMPLQEGDYSAEPKHYGEPSFRRKRNAMECRSSSTLEAT